MTTRTRLLGTIVSKRVLNRSFHAISSTSRSPLTSPCVDRSRAFAKCKSTRLISQREGARHFATSSSSSSPLLDSSGMVWDQYEPERLNSFLLFEKIVRFRNHFQSLKASIEITRRVPKFQAAKLPLELKDSFLAFNEMYARTSDFDENIRHKRLREMCTPPLFDIVETRMEESILTKRSLLGLRVPPRLVQLRLVPVNRESSQPAYAQATISFETVWKDAALEDDTKKRMMPTSKKRKKKIKRGRRKRSTSDTTTTTTPRERWKKQYTNPFGDPQYVNMNTDQIVQGSIPPYDYQDINLDISPLEITENNHTRYAVFEIPLYGGFREWRLASF
jgi:hypothetical protein